MFARARYKYPVEEPKSCPLDLSEVPADLPPIPSDRPGSASRFKGVNKSGKKWVAYIWIPSKGGSVHLGSFDSEEEAGIMHARAHYKYPAHKSAPSVHKRPGMPHRSLDFSTTPVAARDTMSDTSCMVCGLTSDPFIVLLCDGCENEAHLACVGLSHVPDGEWFCSSCRPRGHSQTKATRPRTAPTKPASHSNDTRREAGELDEIDGIMIEAFADDAADFRPSPPSQKHYQFQGTSQLQRQPRARKRSRPRKRKRSRSQSETHSQSQPRPFRHQLLFSSTRADDASNSSK